MNVLEKDDDFGAVVANNKTVIAVFGATWCAPCKALKKSMTESMDLDAEFPNLYFTQIDVDVHPMVASQAGVRGVPSIVKYVDGKIVDGMVGAISVGQLRTFLSK